MIYLYCIFAVVSSLAIGTLIAIGGGIIIGLACTLFLDFIGKVRRYSRNDKYHEIKNINHLEETKSCADNINPSGVITLWLKDRICQAHISKRGKTENDRGHNKGNYGN